MILLNSIFLPIYLDDILIISPNQNCINFVISSLLTTYAIKDVGLAHFFLGIEFFKNMTRYILSKSKYIASLLQATSIDQCKPLSISCSTSSSSSIVHPSTIDFTTYRSIVGALQYITITQHNVSFFVNKAYQKMHSPTPKDWLYLKHLLHYLKGTIFYDLKLCQDNVNTPTIFSNVDKVGSKEDRRSIEAYLIFLGCNLISW